MSERTIALTTIPECYDHWLAEWKARIHTAQQRTALAVNRELVLLYWQIGRDILARQSAQGWGTKVVDRLAHDLRTAFPDMKGFSPGLARRRICASNACTIALVSPIGLAR